MVQIVVDLCMYVCMKTNYILFYFIFIKFIFFIYKFFSRRFYSLNSQVHVRVR